MTQTADGDEEATEAYRLVHLMAKHAPLLERYMHGDYQAVGEEGEYGRVDPDTGAEYRVLVGDDNSYNRDYKVAGVYPKTMFVYGADAKGNAVDHDATKEALIENDLWMDAFTPVILPKGVEHGEVTWWYGFQVRPPGCAPPSMKRYAERVERRIGEDNVFHLHETVEAYVGSLDE